MIVSERIGIDSPNLRDLGQDWLGPLISSVATIGLTVYKGVQEKKAAKTAKKEEATAAAAEAAAAFQTQKMMMQEQQSAARAPGSAGGIPWIPITIAGVGVLGIGTVIILLLKK